MGIPQRSEGAYLVMYSTQQSQAASGGGIVPVLRYRDVRAAVTWLCDAFGFERHAVYADGDVVHHAQLVVRTGETRGMIMCGSARDDAFGKLQSPPSPGAPATQSAYIVV